MPESTRNTSRPPEASFGSESDLVLMAGRKAFDIIRDQGLKPEMVKVVVGAAGGPKWLVLSGLDRVLFPHWLRGRTEPLFLLGSSVGAWRFAAAALQQPEEATKRLQTAFIRQRYHPEATPREMSQILGTMLQGLLGSHGDGEILGHTQFRLSIMAARCKWPVASDNWLLLSLGLFDAALYNVVHRNALKFFFERSLFYDPREVPPFFEMDGFPMQAIPLGRHNLKHALLASASIPMTMCKVRNIPGAPKGSYRDGGVIDHHFDIPFLKDDESIVLFPHYMERIIPGWFDKPLPWRKPQPSNMDHVVVVAPSRGFVERLPHGKIPDRKDYRAFKNDDEERVAYWEAVIEESARLGESFWDIVQTDKARDLVTRLPGTE